MQGLPKQTREFWQQVDLAFGERGATHEISALNNSRTASEAVGYKPHTQTTRNALSSARIGVLHFEGSGCIC